MNQSFELPERLARVVVDPRSYADWDRLHDNLTVIRHEHPFARAQIDGYNPFWVASKFDDIRAVALNNDVFKSGIGGSCRTKRSSSSGVPASAGCSVVSSR